MDPLSTCQALEYWIRLSNKVSGCLSTGGTLLIFPIG
jgi:hypothetical protein